MRTASLKCTISREDQRVLDLLLDVVHSWRLPVTLRIAGGWVRNMLLNLPGQDIDIALDGTDPEHPSKPMTGHAFATYIQRYQSEHDMETHTIGVIHANPTQSKHLETATTHIFGQPIDLLHLRNESYGNGSRIPSIQRGSIVQDAERRDFTVNALYYNLHTKQVEDYVGGLLDLEKRKLRCPLSPRHTFHDDPLRLLRAIRFARQFDLEIDNSVMEAASLPEVHQALREKVSRERIGIEMKKSLGGPDPPQVLSFLFRTQTLGSVFMHCALNPSYSKPCSSYESIIWKPTQWHWSLHACELLKCLTSAGENRFCAVLLALFAPLTENTKNNKMMLPSCILHALKQPRRILQQVDAFLAASSSLTDLLNPLCTKYSGNFTKACIESYFQPQNLLCKESKSPRVTLYELFSSLKSLNFAPPLCIALLQLIPSPLDQASKAPILQLHEIFSSVWQNDPHKITQSSQWKPLLRGDELSKALSLPAKQIGETLQQQMRLQAEFPDLHPHQALDMLRVLRESNSK